MRPQIVFVRCSHSVLTWVEYFYFFMHVLFVYVWHGIVSCSSFNSDIKSIEIFAPL